MNEKTANPNTPEVFIPADSRLWDCPYCDPRRVPPTASDEYIDLQLLVQESERQRIAMDLHDGLGPLITLIRLELQNATKLMCEGSSQLGPARAALSRAEENIARTFDELRRTVFGLRPSMVDDLGILVALGWLIRRFELSGADLAIHGELAEDETRIPAALKIVIFRICQEALNNAIKHSDARNVDVALVIDGDQLRLSVADDGCGIGLQGHARRSHGGLAGMIRRADSSNGKISIVSEFGAGTNITVCWPLIAPANGLKPAPLQGRNPREPQISH